jgi:hyperosmotically inducible periplasmic protein
MGAGSSPDGPLTLIGETPSMYKRSLPLILAGTAVVVMVLTGCNKSPQTPATLPAAPTTAPAAANVSDIDITEHVKTALQQNGLLKGRDITVVTLKGDVRLMGTLDSQGQIDEAIKIARASEGAHAIHSELTLKK